MKKTCIMVYGRFNPVHNGHIKIFKSALEYQSAIMNSDLKIYVSPTVDKKCNPLPYELKIQMISEYCPEIAPYIQNEQGNTLFSVLEILNEKYDHLILLCGSDRQDTFESVINNYNGLLYNFDSIYVLNMGDRDTSPYSSTYMRYCVESNDYESFITCLPNDKPELNEWYFNVIAACMGINYDIQN